jgi:hypothetical protein
MTTQVRTQESEDGHGRWTPLVLTALTLAVLGAAAFWQLQSGGEEATAPAAVGVPASRGSTATATDGVMPLGGLAERYQEERRAGMDEAAPPVGEVDLTDGAGHDRTTPAMAPRDGAPAAAAAGLATAPVAGSTMLSAVIDRHMTKTAAPTIYLAGSQAQAEAIRAALDDDAALIQAVNALPAAGAAVAVIETDDDHLRLLQLTGAADAVNAALGLPILRVVDRRAP